MKFHLENYKGEIFGNCYCYFIPFAVMDCRKVINTMNYSCKIMR